MRSIVVASTLAFSTLQCHITGWKPHIAASQPFNDEMSRARATCPSQIAWSTWSNSWATPWASTKRREFLCAGFGRRPQTRHDHARVKPSEKSCSQAPRNDDLHSKNTYLFRASWHLATSGLCVCLHIDDFRNLYRTLLVDGLSSRTDPSSRN